MKCGIVILNYNDYPTTEELLSKIKDYPEIEHIVVVDNNSPNDSYTHLKKYSSPTISVIQSGKNGGYSFGNNCGARYLIDNFHPDIIGIANPDTEFDGSFIAKIKEVFTKHPDYAVLTGLQFTPSGDLGVHPFWEDESTPALMCKRVVSEIFKRFTVRKYKAYLEGIRNSGQELNQVWAVEGSLFFIRSEDFEKAGLFDENVFLYYEENILAFKLQKLGRKTGVINTITYLHNHRAPKNTTPLYLLNRYMNGMKYTAISAQYYFNNYVTSSKFSKCVYAFLLNTNYILRSIKAHAKYFIRKVTTRS